MQRRDPGRLKRHSPLALVVITVLSNHQYSYNSRALQRRPRIVAMNLQVPTEIRQFVKALERRRCKVAINPEVPTDIRPHLEALERRHCSVAFNPEVTTSIRQIFRGLAPT